MRNWFIPLLIATLPSAALADEWYEEDYNPVPMDGDVILPMPCDGRIVFRKVETNLVSGVEGGAYADRAIRLGWDGARESAYREGEWKSFVAGGLIDERSRYYLIGKYELTEDQFNTLVSPDCDDTDVDFGAPFSSLTWFDAIQFSHLYSVWLHNNAAADLPVSIGSTAYVRPPTEAEWEFAARGGLEVSDSERRNQRFPMDGGLSEYAFFSGDGISNGDLQFIGKKLPNPLGLFDVYGNAFEIVFDPFRLNKAGRMHGHFGAMTIKGGSIRSSAEEIRSGARQEVPLYNAQIEGSIARRTDVGLRLVISGVSTGDQQHSDILANSWNALVDDSVIDTDQPPVQLLRSLADESDDAALQNRLNRIAADIENNLRERDELEELALLSLLQSGNMAVYRLRGIFENIELQHGQRVHEISRSPELLADETEAMKRGRFRAIEAYESNLTDFGRFAEIYAGIFLQLTENYPHELVLNTARSLVQELQSQGRTELANNLTILGRRLSDYSDETTWDRSEQVLGMLQLAYRFGEQPPWFNAAINRR